MISVRHTKNTSIISMFFPHTRQMPTQSAPASQSPCSTSQHSCDKCHHCYQSHHNCYDACWIIHSVLHWSSLLDRYARPPKNPDINRAKLWTRSSSVPVPKGMGTVMLYTTKLTPANTMNMTVILLIMCLASYRSAVPTSDICLGSSSKGLLSSTPFWDWFLWDDVCFQIWTVSTAPVCLLALNTCPTCLHHRSVWYEAYDLSYYLWSNPNSDICSVGPAGDPVIFCFWHCQIWCLL